MRFDSEFETLIGWIEGHMTFFWRILENNTSRTMTKPWQWTMTNHDSEPWQTMTVNHDEPWRTMTKPWQWNITNHDETSRTMTNHDETSRTMTKHHEPWRNIMNHHEPPQSLIQNEIWYWILDSD